KIGIPDKILLKPGKLSSEEFEVMKTHTTIGAQLLSRSKSRILEMAREIALTHHERYDGQGYPNGLKGKDIPLSGRIVSIVDAFDALTSKRPYKDPYPPHIALDVIRKEKGRHFDPELTDLFITYFSEFLKIRETIGYFEEVDLENFMLSERDQADFRT
ncbi:MAG: HD domain-containing protein, partial [Desulfobacterales bacterium]|nr:HD domain-containing protein [Desulfobacterales bacterium]